MNDRRYPFRPLNLLILSYGPCLNLFYPQGYPETLHAPPQIASLHSATNHAYNFNPISKISLAHFRFFNKYQEVLQPISTKLILRLLQIQDQVFENSLNPPPPLEYFLPHAMHSRSSGRRSPHSQAQPICLAGFPTTNA